MYQGNPFPDGCLVLLSFDVFFCLDPKLNGNLVDLSFTNASRLLVHVLVLSGLNIFAGTQWYLLP